MKVGKAVRELGEAIRLLRELPEDADVISVDANLREIMVPFRELMTLSRRTGAKPEVEMRPSPSYPVGLYLPAPGGRWTFMCLLDGEDVERHYDELVRLYPSKRAKLLAIALSPEKRTIFGGEHEEGTPRKS